MTVLSSMLSLEEANMDIVKGTQKMRTSGNNCQHSHYLLLNRLVNDALPENLSLNNLNPLSQMQLVFTA